MMKMYKDDQIKQLVAPILLLLPLGIFLTGITPVSYLLLLGGVIGAYLGAK